MLLCEVDMKVTTGIVTSEDMTANVTGSIKQFDLSELLDAIEMFILLRSFSSSGSFKSNFESVVFADLMLVGLNSLLGVKTLHQQNLHSSHRCQCN